MKKVIFFLLAFFLAFPGVSFATSYPDYSSYVNDFSHVLSTGYVTQLNAKLSDFYHKTTNQIAVVTVDTTQPETIEQYSIHLAEKWKVGQKGKDNGVIMLFAMQDHKMRIEVGRGLEGDLTDIQSKHIQKEVIEPEFIQGKYEQGITKGVNAVVATITHDASSSAYVSANQNEHSQSNGSQIPINVIEFVLFLIIVFLLIAFSPHTPLGGAGVWGLTTLWGGRDGNNDEGGGPDGFGGGSFSGGGSSDSW